MTEKELLLSIGQRIKKIRLDKGMSQIALAALINYEKSNMSRLESGTGNPTVTTLFRVANALEVSLTDLLQD